MTGVPNIDLDTQGEQVICPSLPLPMDVMRRSETSWHDMPLHDPTTPSVAKHSSGIVSQCCSSTACCHLERTTTGYLYVGIGAFTPTLTTHLLPPFLHGGGRSGTRLRKNMVSVGSPAFCGRLDISHCQY